MDIEAAKATGAMMLFGEKYGDTVRVLDIGTSRELCGGTHVQRTGDIGLFKIVSEGGVAAGVRRIEAVTGANALAYLQELEATVQQRGRHAEGAGRRAAGAHRRRCWTRCARWRRKWRSSRASWLPRRATSWWRRRSTSRASRCWPRALDGADAKTLRDTMDKLKDKLKTAAIVLAAVDGGKVQIAAGVTADSMGKVKAGELVNFVAQQVGGKGGGKPDMAMAGGTDASKLPGALQSVQAGWRSGP